MEQYRAIDLLISERVMGLHFGEVDEEGYVEVLPHYSTNMKHAYAVLSKLQKLGYEYTIAGTDVGFTVSLKLVHPERARLGVSYNPVSVHSHKLAKAICMAAITALRTDV